MSSIFDNPESPHGPILTPMYMTQKMPVPYKWPPRNVSMMILRDGDWPKIMRGANIKGLTNISLIIAKG